MPQPVPQKGLSAHVWGQWPPKLGPRHRPNARHTRAHLVLTVTRELGGAGSVYRTLVFSGREQLSQGLPGDRVSVPARASPTPKPCFFYLSAHQKKVWGRGQSHRRGTTVWLAGGNALKKGVPRS